MPASAPEMTTAMYFDPVDGDPQRVRRRRVLAARTQPQPERGAPEQQVGRRDQQHGQDREHADLVGEPAEDAGHVADQEPVLPLEVAQQVRPRGEHRQGDARRLARQRPVTG